MSNKKNIKIIDSNMNVGNNNYNSATVKSAFEKIREFSKNNNLRLKENKKG